MSETFNLVDEPWIEVLDDDGKSRAVSLREALLGASGIRRLAGELPTQDVAIIRLLLAILHRALPVDGNDETVMRTWGQWWAQGHPPEADVGDYLEEWHGRFDLLDPTRPFLQAGDLHTASGGTTGLGKLIADLPAGHKFFTNRAGEGATRLSLAEAARWLVHCHAFDASGIKTGVVGDDRVKGGKAYPRGTGWAGNLGVLVLEGTTLAQTLLLNLVLTTPSPDEDRPPWEEDEPMTAGTSGRQMPRGPAQALVWPGRRVRLNADVDEIYDVTITYGDDIRVRNQHLVETMSPFRRSQPQEKKHGEELVYMPRQHRQGRAVWRGLDSLIAANPVKAGAAARSVGLGSRNVDWVAGLRRTRMIATEDMITLHVVGAVYGTQSAFIETLIDDRVVLRVEVLDVPELQDAAVRCAAMAETAATSIRLLARSLDEAAGLEGGEAPDRASEALYAEVDVLFRRWVGRLSTDRRSEQEVQWREEVRRVAEGLGDELCAAAGQAAIRGRVVMDRNQHPVRVDAALARARFQHRIRTDLPIASDEQDQQPKEDQAS